jgi:hypothetical protein
MIDYLYPDWKTRELEAPMASNVFPNPCFTDAQLINAVLKAMKATPVHRMSPAWAVQHILYEAMRTGYVGPGWAIRFLEMKSTDYSLRWDVSLDVWNEGGAIEFSGREIAHICAYWVAKGFSFETHNIELLPDFGRPEGRSDAAEALQVGGDFDDLGTRDFPLPLPNKIVRYLWIREYDGHVRLRYLDIINSDHYGKYEFVVQEEGNPEIIAFAQDPIDRHLLELKLYAGLLPITASSPCFRDINSWLCLVTDARIKNSKRIVEVVS